MQLKSLHLTKAIGLLWAILCLCMPVGMLKAESTLYSLSLGNVFYSFDSVEGKLSAVSNYTNRLPYLRFSIGDNGNGDLRFAFKSGGEGTPILIAPLDLLSIEQATTYSNPHDVAYFNGEIYVVNAGRTQIDKLVGGDSFTNIISGYDNIGQIIWCGDQYICFTYDGGKIGLVDTVTKVVTLSPNLVSSPHYLAYSQQSKHVYISVSQSVTIYRLSRAGFGSEALQTIANGSHGIGNPGPIAIDPSTSADITRLAVIDDGGFSLGITEFKSDLSIPVSTFDETSSLDTLVYLAYTPDASGGGGSSDEPQCDDNIDNDGDSLIDFPEDPGCANANDQSEDNTCPGGGDESDIDNDGTPACLDECPEDGNKIAPGECGCGVLEDTGDADSDGAVNCQDSCSQNKFLVEPMCGVGNCVEVVDPATGFCAVPSCDQQLYSSPFPPALGCQCGQELGFDGSCNDPDDSSDVDLCPSDPAKTLPGVCGCGVPDVDPDLDGALNCNDQCPNNPHLTQIGKDCGCLNRNRNADGTVSCGERADLMPDLPLGAPQVRYTVKNNDNVVLKVAFDEFNVLPPDLVAAKKKEKKSGRKKLVQDNVVYISSLDRSTLKTKTIKKVTRKKNFKTVVKKGKGDLITVRVQAKQGRKARKPGRGGRNAPATQVSPPTVLVPR